MVRIRNSSSDVVEFCVSKADHSLHTPVNGKIGSDWTGKYLCAKVVIPPTHELLIITSTNHASTQVQMCQVNHHKSMMGVVEDRRGHPTVSTSLHVDAETRRKILLPKASPRTAGNE